MENGERPLRPADGHPDAATTDDVRPTMSVGLFADPGFPVEVACAIAEGLPGLLEHQVGDRWAWKVRWHGRRLVADEQGAVRLPAIVRDMARHGHDLVVCLTDQPRRAGVRPIVAEACVRQGVALASVPALGILHVRNRTADAVVGLVRELVGASDVREGTAVPVGATSTSGRPLARLDRVVPGDGAADVRFLGTGWRARLRLLAGMVLANRPWRLVPRLTAPFAAALATAAFVLVNTTVWQMADHLSPLRLATATMAAVAAMVAWLIVDHGMWERPDAPPARRLAVLYNTATALSLALGILCLYVGLLVVGLVAGALLIDSTILGQTLGRAVGPGDYVRLAWLSASMATVAGAVGTGFESDEAVREAAYGIRQRERREAMDRNDADDANGVSGAGPGPGHRADDGGRRPTR
jgi:hypothetical protein